MPTKPNCYPYMEINFPSISKIHANLQESNSVRLLGLKVFTDMKRNYYIELVARSVANKVGLSCQTI